MKELNLQLYQGNGVPINERNQVFFDGPGERLLADIAIAGYQQQGGLLIIAFPTAFPADRTGGPVQITLHDSIAHLLVFIRQGLADNTAAADFIIVHDHKPAS